MDVVIVNLTCIDLVQHVLMTIMHASIVAVQDKARSYTKQVPGDDFIPLAIETYGCFHLHFDSFLTSHVHATIVRHQQTSLIPSMLISYYKQQVLIIF